MIFIDSLILPDVVNIIPINGNMYFVSWIPGPQYFHLFLKRMRSTWEKPTHISGTVISYNDTTSFSIYFPYCPTFICYNGISIGNILYIL